MENKGRIVLLSENLVEGKCEFLGENGLSIYLESGGTRYLFDTGFGRTLNHNASLMGIELNKLDGIILSHSHADHTEGIPEVLKHRKSIDVYTHPYLFNYRYRLNKTNEKVYGGIPYTKSYLERKGARFKFNREFLNLGNQLYLTGEIPRVNPFEKSDLSGRYVEIEGKTERDIILEEQALLITSGKGLIIINGCSHSGLLNTIEHALKITGQDSIYCIIGGTHLAYAEEEQIEKTIEDLGKYRIKRLITGHCTGIEAASRLKHRYPDLFEFSYTGKEIEF